MAAEAKLQKWAHRELRKAGWLVVKISLTSKNGWPDTELIRKNRTVRIEFKAEGRNLDPLQKYIHKQIKKHGGEVYRVDSKEEFNKLQLT